MTTQRDDADRQQERDIAALLESNKSMQLSLDRMREDNVEWRREFREWLKAIEDKMSERSDESRRQREDIIGRVAALEKVEHVSPTEYSSRMSALESAERVSPSEFAEVKHTASRLEKLAWLFAGALVTAGVTSAFAVWQAVS